VIWLIGLPRPLARKAAVFARPLKPRLPSDYLTGLFRFSR
jgi:hypothetical protein